MTTRRSFLAAAAVAATAAALRPLPALALTVPPPTLLRRAIPSTGEQVPVIGMGTSGSFEVDAAGREPLRQVAGFAGRAEVGVGLRPDGQCLVQAGAGAGRVAIGRQHPCPREQGVRLGRLAPLQQVQPLPCLRGVAGGRGRGDAERRSRPGRRA